jgi:hypothetical protein
LQEAFDKFEIVGEKRQARAGKENRLESAMGRPSQTVCNRSETQKKLLAIFRELNFQPPAANRSLQPFGKKLSEQMRA